MASAKEISAAFQCLLHPNDGCRKYPCPYYHRASMEEQMEFCMAANVSLEKIDDKFWGYCDRMQLWADALELIEQLTEKKG